MGFLSNKIWVRIFLGHPTIMLHNNLLRPVLTTWKNPLLPPWKNSFWCPSSFVCRSGFLKIFAHVPLSIKWAISFRDTWCIWCNNITAQIRPWFSMDQMVLEPELEPKTLDAWSQSRSFEISVPPPQPCFRPL